MSDYDKIPVAQESCKGCVFTTAEFGCSRPHDFGDFCTSSNGNYIFIDSVKVKLKLICKSWKS